MDGFQCTRCGKKFEKRCNFINHLSRRTVCEPNLRDIPIEEVRQHFNMAVVRYACRICNRTFTSASRLEYHVNNNVCVRDIDINNVTPQPPSVVHNNQNNIHIVNVSTVPFAAEGKRDFRKERVDHITMEKINAYFAGDPHMGLTKLIDDIYFNPEVPENHTIRIHPVNSHLAYIVKDGEICVVPVSYATRLIMITNSNLIHYLASHESLLCEVFMRDGPSDPYYAEFKSRQDQLSILQKWVNNHMMGESRDAKRNASLVGELIAAHLCIRHTPISPSSTFYSTGLTCSNDEYVPPPADECTVSWQKQLLLAPPLAPLSMTLGTPSCAS